jgi:hypothetical protein
MSSEKTRVIAAVLDDRELKLYKEDGSTITMLQGDFRIDGILKQAIPAINSVGYVDLDLTSPNYWSEYEKKSSGLVRFFRVAKNALSSIFGGNTPGSNQPVSVGAVPDPSSVQKAMNDSDAVAQIMKHAKPVALGSTDSASMTKKDETLIAVVGKEKPTVVPGVENLKRQVERATISGDTVGVDAFMQRISAVISKRRHSIEELMRFMQRGDLPVSVSGGIVIYKVLRRHAKGGYVDCHSRRVHQRVGSLVRMREELVDFNRNAECSNGLHVARREYIHGFSGDVCVVAVVRPEDVITVPQYDANKMRVCAYHILFELTPESYRRLKSNQPIEPTSPDAKLLALALADGFPRYNQIVEIKGHMGQDLEITDLDETGSPVVVKAPLPTQPAIPLPVSANPATEEHENDLTAPAVDPRKVAEQVSQEQTNVISTQVAGAPVGSTGADSSSGGAGEAVNNSKPLTQSQQAQKLYTEFLDKKTDAKAQPNDVMASAKALLLFKQKSKKSWKALGFAEDLTSTLTDALPKS